MERMDHNTTLLILTTMQSNASSSWFYSSDGVCRVHAGYRSQWGEILAITKAISHHSQIVKTLQYLTD
jgi:hypothetical protein